MTSNPNNRDLEILKKELEFSQKEHEALSMKADALTSDLYVINCRKRHLLARIGEIKAKIAN